MLASSVNSRLRIPETVALRLCVMLRRENFGGGGSSPLLDCKECLGAACGEEEALAARALACPRVAERFERLRAHESTGWP